MLNNCAQVKNDANKIRQTVSECRWAICEYYVVPQLFCVDEISHSKKLEVLGGGGALLSSQHSRGRGSRISVNLRPA